MTPPALILASGSAIRAQILRAAGVVFGVRRPDVDEASIKRAAAGEGLSLQATAQRLADAKALSVGAPGAVVLGSDQIMAFEGRGFDKPRSMAEARERLRLLQGRSHTLINAVAIARDGRVAFRHVDETTFRSVCEEVSGRDLRAFFDTWLHSTRTPDTMRRSRSSGNPCSTNERCEKLESTITASASRYSRSSRSMRQLLGCC